LNGVISQWPFFIIAVAPFGASFGNEITPLDRTATDRKIERKINMFCQINDSCPLRWTNSSCQSHEQKVN